MFSNHQRILWSLVILILAVISCSPLAAPEPLPTLSAENISTIVAQTAQALNAQTQAVPPTATLEATPTDSATNTPLPPTDTPAPTPTFFFVLPSPTPFSVTVPPVVSGGGGGGGGGAPAPTATPRYACQILSQTPASGVKVKPEADFDFVWKVKNTGANAWDKATHNLVFNSGTNFFKKNSYTLSGTVNTDGEITLAVDVFAPKKTGTYRASWVIKGDKGIVCLLSVSITVVK